MAIVLAVTGGLPFGTGVLGAAPPDAEASRPTTGKTAVGSADHEPALPEKAAPLNRRQTVFIDAAGKRLFLKTKVVLRRGQLEMLCCLKQTKEHESILSIDSKAYVVHAGLLALGAKPGHPVQFVPEFKPPSGQRIDIFARWKDAKGHEHRVPAQKWIRTSPDRFYVVRMDRLPDDLTLPDDLPLRYDEENKELSWYGHMTRPMLDRLLKLSRDPGYQKAIRKFFADSQYRPMTAHWVFAGSTFFVDPATGRSQYGAEGGELICVANFTTATIDVAAPSSASNDALLYEADTNRIPPVGTPVLLELVPVFEKPNNVRPARGATSEPSGGAKPEGRPNAP
ncbi:MAG: hypothetical protein D6725_05940 [Planctomycetota bacterium]|nr:MAG: hypothetical protein D6725_05940 [Planctomycetota bacterium]